MKSLAYSDRFHQIVLENSKLLLTLAIAVAVAVDVGVDVGDGVYVGNGRFQESYT